MLLSSDFPTNLLNLSILYHPYVYVYVDFMIDTNTTSHQFTEIRTDNNDQNKSFQKTIKNLLEFI